jgi:hypothetical protein
MGINSNSKKLTSFWLFNWNIQSYNLKEPGLGFILITSLYLENPELKKSQSTYDKMKYKKFHKIVFFFFDKMFISVAKDFLAYRFLTQAWF